MGFEERKSPEVTQTSPLKPQLTTLGFDWVPRSKDVVNNSSYNQGVALIKII